MDTFIIYIRVLGEIYSYTVHDKTTALDHVKRIKQCGYKHFEGNAVMIYMPEQIHEIRYFQN